MDFIDLNLVAGDGLPEQRDHGCISGSVQVVFREHLPRLTEIIYEAGEQGLVCVGSVAWLTEFTVLDALATLATAIVVQKEDFLRPDHGDDVNPVAWKAVLHEKYDAVAESDEHHPLFRRQNMPDPLGGISLFSNQRISGVRCFGNRNRRDGKQRRTPLMHHKYLIFADLSLEPEPAHEGDEVLRGTIRWDPRFVWTGSCNLSNMARRSRENSVIIRKPAIAQAYLKDWAELMSVSEPLDWDADWVDPQWHEGT